MTLKFIIHSLPFTSDPSTTAYRSVLVEPMCSFCLELLSLPTLPKEKGDQAEHSHYFIGKNLLEVLHSTTGHRTSVILKSYLNILKHLQYSFMNQEELQILLEFILRLEEMSFNSSTTILNTIKSIGEQIQSCLKLIEKFVS